jgi:hypothetical protein
MRFGEHKSESVYFTAMRTLHVAYRTCMRALHSRTLRHSLADPLTDSPNVLYDRRTDVASSIVHGRSSHFPRIRRVSFTPFSCRLYAKRRYSIHHHSIEIIERAQHSTVYQITGGVWNTELR